MGYRWDGQKVSELLLSAPYALPAGRARNLVGAD